MMRCLPFGENWAVWEGGWGEGLNEGYHGMRREEITGTHQT